MKKLLLMVLCSAGALVYADADLRVKNFAKPEKGSSEIVSAGWLDHSLKITAPADADSEVVYNKLFSFNPRMFYKVQGDLSGDGKVFVKIYFFNKDGTPYKVAEKSAVVHQEWDEFESRFNLSEFTLADAPHKFKIAVGVKKGGTVVLDDLELEVDND